MQHLYQFLQSKRLPVKEILSCNCQITEKIDGSAFQYYKHQNKVMYGKRPNAPYIPSKNIIDEFDLIMNNMYNNAYNIIHKNEDKIPSDIEILNFEIFDRNKDNHIIKYNGEYKNDIVLLSGYDMFGCVLPECRLKEISELLDISCINLLYDDYFDEAYILSLMENKCDTEKIWYQILSLLDDKIDSKNVEGFVLTFNEHTDIENINRIVKVQSPMFHEKIMEHLDEEKNMKQAINLENIYNLFINNNDLNYNEDYNPVKKICQLYLALEIINKDFSNIENILKNIEILRNQEINIKLISKYYYMFPSRMEDIEYPTILKFLFLTFRNKRVKTPLWCSLDYQLNIVNPFIENYIFCKKQTNPLINNIKNNLEYGNRNAKSV